MINTCTFCQSKIKVKKRRRFCSHVCYKEYNRIMALKTDPVKWAKAQLYAALNQSDKKLSPLDGKLLIQLETYYETITKLHEDKKHKPVKMLEWFNAL